LQPGKLSGLLRRIQSLRVVIALSVVAGVVLASTLAFVQQTANLREQHTAQIRLELDRLSALTALALREPLWQFVPEQADSIVEGAFTNPDVVSIQVFDHQGTPFAGRSRTVEHPDLVEAASLTVKRDNSVVGRLNMKMSTAGYVAKVAQARAQFLGSAVQTSLIALVFILVLLHWRLARPLDKLVSASDRIAHGE